MQVFHAITIFAVSDLQRSIDFYAQRLGFHEERRFDCFAVVRRDACRIGLSAPGDPRQGVPGAGEVYIVCDEVDEHWRAIVQAGVTVDANPRDQDYGMRDFTLRDPDGNVITFGADSRKALDRARDPHLESGG